MPVDQHWLDEQSFSQCGARPVGLHLPMSAPPMRPGLFPAPDRLGSRAEAGFLVEHDLLGKPVQLARQPKVALVPPPLPGHLHMALQPFRAAVMEELSTKR